MKFNKIFLGLAVTGFVFTSCSDDVEYTPAEAVATPPVYFSMNDETRVDLEEDSRYFSLPVYRQNTSGAQNATVTIDLTAADGSSVAGLFTVGEIVTKPVADIQSNEVNLGTITDADGQATDNANVFVPAGQDSQFAGTDPAKETANVSFTFADGAGSHDVIVYFDNVANLTQMLDYNFAVKANGESSPYFITKIDYSVAFTPWETIDEGPVLFRDYLLLAPSTAGQEFEYEVTAQKHPLKKDFYRFPKPFSMSPLGSYYVLDPALPNYLYINAANEKEVFFSDKNGDYQLLYDTGLEFFSGVEGTQKIACDYCYYKTETDLDAYGYVIPYANLSGAGELVNGRIVFGSNLHVILPGIDSAWASKTFTVVFPWAASEWAELGVGQYTDGFLTEVFEEVIPTAYPVTVEQHLEEPDRFRLVSPYGYGIWPSELAVPWDIQYNMEIDCSNPECVVIPEQIIFEDGDGAIEGLNAGYAFQNMLDQPLTPDEIIAEGMNDTYKDGVISINWPIIIWNKTIYQLYDKAPMNQKWSVPGKLVLPTGTEEAVAAAKARKAARTANNRFDAEAARVVNRAAGNPKK